MVTKSILTVNAPSRPGSGVNALVADTRRVTRTRLRAGAAIDPNLEAQRVYLIGETRYAVRKSLGVGNQLLRLVVATALHRPAVV